MTYRNNGRNKGVRWSIAVYVKKHLNFRIGNALLNAMC